MAIVTPRARTSHPRRTQATWRAAASAVIAAAEPPLTRSPIVSLGQMLNNQVHRAVSHAADLLCRPREVEDGARCGVQASFRFYQERTCEWVHAAVPAASMDAGRSPWIGEAVHAIAVVVDAVAGAKEVNVIVEGEAQDAALDGDVLARPVRVGREDACVDSRLERCWCRAPWL